MRRLRRPPRESALPGARRARSLGESRARAGISCRRHRRLEHRGAHRRGERRRFLRPARDIGVRRRGDDVRRLCGAGGEGVGAHSRCARSQRESRRGTRQHRCRTDASESGRRRNRIGARRLFGQLRCGGARGAHTSRRREGRQRTAHRHPVRRAHHPARPRHDLPGTRLRGPARHAGVRSPDSPRRYSS